MRIKQITSQHRCDGNQCDDTGIPCEAARQIIYAREGDIRDLQNELVHSREENFYGGILVCLQILHVFDSHVQATDIVNSTGGMREIEKHAKAGGSEVDMVTVKWLKTGKR